MNPARAGFRTQLKSEGKVAAYKELETTRSFHTGFDTFWPFATKKKTDNFKFYITNVILYNDLTSLITKCL